MKIRRALANACLVMFGLTVGLLLVEAGLRSAAFVTGRWYAFESAAPAPGRVRILALGDSNTFGLHVGKIHAYPDVLEARWNVRGDRHPIDVVNVGYPGNTSWSIRARLGDLLAAYQPQVVTVMVGANDSWRDGERQGDLSVEACVARAGMSPRPPDVPRTEEWRLVRALRLVEPYLPQPPEHLLFGDPRPPRKKFDPAWPSDLAANLEFIGACATGAGVQVVFLTYPSRRFPYDIANEALRVVAARGRVPVIDLARRFAEPCSGARCEYLFSDQHPTASGHARVADIMAEALPGALPSLGLGR